MSEQELWDKLKALQAQEDAIIAQLVALALARLNAEGR